MKIDDFFPFDSYRKGQLEALRAIVDAFDNEGYKYVTLHAPTGSGKSPMAIALAKYYEKKDEYQSNILTIQKILQDQYVDSFPQTVFPLKGRSGYKCNHISASSGDNCLEGPCRTKKVSNPECPYTNARKVAMDHPCVVHNFHSYYYNTSGNMWSMRKRGLMVIDEAHNIEQTCLDFMEFEITNANRPMEIPIFSLPHQYESLMQSEKQIAFDRIRALDDLPELSKEQLREKELHNGFIEKVNRYFRTKNENQYVVDYHDMKNHQKVVFKPVLVGDFVRGAFLSGPERVLMMSATLIDKEQFCKGIGLDPDEVKHIVVPNSFPARNRPIVKKYAGSMSFKTKDDTLPQMIPVLESLLKKYPNTKGIIHTHSESNATYIKHNLFDPRLTFRRDYRTVKQMMDVHSQKHASIIVASGLREGLDLDEDLGRLQILMKVPYPSLGEKRVKIKMKMDNEWYGYITSMFFVQTIGRCVRSETDKAHTYLLDKDFGRFFGMNKKFIPAYIKEAVVG